MVEALVIFIGNEVIGYRRRSKIFVVIREEVVVIKRAEEFIEGFNVVVESSG